MATLDKLAIRGIRSFVSARAALGSSASLTLFLPHSSLARQDDKSVNIIQFQTPITVIVGYNGSGKTSM